MESLDVTTVLDRSIAWLQTVVAGLLVVLFLLGVVNLGVLVARSFVEQGVLDLQNVLDLISSSIDVVLYLFIIAELYKTIIAYVEAQSVVLAVIHAGLIAVVRQIITFKPADAGGANEVILQAGTYAVLLLALLIGFVVVHYHVDGEEP